MQLKADVKEGQHCALPCSCRQRGLHHHSLQQPVPDGPSSGWCHQRCNGRVQRCLQALPSAASQHLSRSLEGTPASLLCLPLSGHLPGVFPAPTWHACLTAVLHHRASALHMQPPQQPWCMLPVRPAQQGSQGRLRSRGARGLLQLPPHPSAPAPMQGSARSSQICSTQARLHGKGGGGGYYSGESS